jgi:single-strand DNA-binding protein
MNSNPTSKERNFKMAQIGTVNKVTIVGNLGRDPEIRTMQNGNKVVTLSVATTESWRDRNSEEYKQKTEWHRVVIFNEHLVKVAEKHLEKGTKIYLEGQLQTRKWTDNKGQEKYTTEVVLPRFRGELQLLSGGKQSENCQDHDTVQDFNPDYPDDEIPF